MIGTSTHAFLLRYLGMERRLSLLGIGILLLGCGGGGQSSVPIAPEIPADPWAAVTATLDAASVVDLAFVIGDAEGNLYSYEKGAFRLSATHAIASASKWLTSATILALIEQGAMGLEDQPQRYLSYWTSDPTDARSRITLDQLLSFTAGFHRSPSQAGCIGDDSYSLQECVEQLYAMGVDAEPGTTYFYGPIHMQVAAAMAEQATDQAWSEIVRLTLREPLGLSTATGFSGRNPRASGSATGSALDYAEFLRLQLAGGFLANSLDQLITERLSAVTIVSRPNTISANNLDWYYGLGVWRECDQPMWDSICASERRISSPGAFGWYPWLDLDNGYYAVLAMEEPLTLTSSPSVVAVSLGSELRPLILDALNAL